jgi:hypothetical protein
MTYEAFQTEVTAAIAAIEAARSGALTKMPRTDYSLDVCECAAEITGADSTLCKMFNRKFRTDAAQMMMVFNRKFRTDAAQMMMERSPA